MRVAVEKLNNLINNLDRMTELVQRQQSTIHDLRMLLLLASVEPRVMEGKSSHVVRCVNPARYLLRPQDYVMVIRFRIGEPDEGSVTVRMEDVPQDFWPHGLRERTNKRPSGVAVDDPWRAIKPARSDWGM